MIGITLPRFHVFMDDEKSPRSGRKQSASKRKDSKALKTSSSSNRVGSPPHRRTSSTGVPVQLEDSSSSFEDLNGNPFADDANDSSDPLLPRQEPLPVGSLNGGKVMQRRMSIGSQRADASNLSDSQKGMQKLVSGANVRGIFMGATPSIQAATSPRNGVEQLRETMLTVPELTANTSEEMFTLRNMYFNLKKEIIVQMEYFNQQLVTMDARHVEATTKQMRAIRQNMVGTQYLLTDISRGGEFTVTNNAVVPLVEPRTEISYRKKKKTCFGWF